MIGFILYPPLLPNSAGMYWLLQESVALSVPKHVCYCVVSVLFVLFCFWLLSVCRKDTKAIKAITVPSESQTTACCIWEFLSCPLCYLVPLNNKICAHGSLSGFGEMSLLHVFLLPPCPGSNTHAWKALGRAGPWGTCSELPSLPHWYCVPQMLSPPLEWTAPQSQAKTTCSFSVCPTGIWTSRCTQLRLSGALLLHSCYFLDLSVCCRSGELW